MRKIRLLMMDDNPLLIAGVRHYLAEPFFPECQIELISCAPQTQAFLSVLEVAPPHVVLVSLQSKPQSIALARDVRTHCPHTKVILYVDVMDTALMHQALMTGIHGLISHTTTPHILQKALLAVYLGGLYYHPEAICPLIRPEVASPQHWPNTSLSRRETEILELLTQDFSREQIAHKLALSPRTVETYTYRLMDKLNIRSLVGLTRYAIAQGISPLQNCYVCSRPAS
jgi:DNA-binding NarL/FixJ family response regulator